MPPKKNKGQKDAANTEDAKQQEVADQAPADQNLAAEGKFNLFINSYINFL